MTWRVELSLRFGTWTLHVDLKGDPRPVALIGPNGSGKTSVLRAVAGAFRPEGGCVQFGDTVVFDGEKGVWLPPEARQVGYVPQGYSLFPHLNVVDNVAFGELSRAPRVSRAERRKRAHALLETMGCASLAERAPQGLSGGERQRVALARALMMEPRFLLLDEPLASMDVSARRAFRGFLSQRLKEWGKPALIVTHDARDVWALDANIVAIEDGRVVQRGSAAELTADPATSFVAEFFDATGLKKETRHDA